MSINLLPPQLRRRRGVDWPRVATSALLITAIILPIGYGISAQLRLYAYDKLIAGGKAEYQALLPAVQRKQELDKVEAEFRQKQQFINELRGQGVSWAGILAEVQRVIPATVSLTEFSTSGDRIVIRGRGGSLQAIAQFALALERGAHLQKADFVALLRDTDGSIVFDMSAGMRKGVTGR